MLPKLLTSIFGSRNDRLLKQYRQVVAQINALEPQFEALDDAALRAKTDEFRNRVAAGESLDKLLPEAFAVVREGSKRVLKMRHFDVQLIGGMALHNGKIAEMRTGEGKTLMATLPVYLNALPRSSSSVSLATAGSSALTLRTASPYCLSRRSLRLPKMRVRMLEIIRKEGRVRGWTTSGLRSAGRAKKQGVRTASPLMPLQS